MAKVIDPIVLKILQLLAGKTFKQASDLLYEVQNYIEALAELKTLDTEALANELAKFNSTSWED